MVRNGLAKVGLFPPTMSASKPRDRMCALTPSAKWRAPFWCCHPRGQRSGEVGGILGLLHELHDDGACILLAHNAPHASNAVILPTLTPIRCRLGFKPIKDYCGVHFRHERVKWITTCGRSSSSVP